MGSQRIRKLDANVVNYIAAGEVVQRPYNVVKELIENSIDAGTTIVAVEIEAGGVQSIRIQDNGAGIAPEDLALVCERHATSKLSTVDDMLSLTTFGFRGEALASVSLVANVAIISRTAHSPCAYRQTYAGVCACIYAC
jgi:DNA mismatch repair protein MLH1